jgi:DNA-binding winged helix-turn-helix (wHTH) protein
VFPPPLDYTDDEVEREFPSDNETLSATMSSLRRQRRQSRPQRYIATTHRMGRAVVSDSEEETEDRTTTRSRPLTNPSDDDSDWEQ